MNLELAGLKKASSINFKFVLIIYTADFPFLSVPYYPTIWEVAVTHARNKNKNYLGSHFRQPRKWNSSDYAAIKTKKFADTPKHPLSLPPSLHSSKKKLSKLAKCEIKRQQQQQRALICCVSVCVCVSVFSHISKQMAKIRWSSRYVPLNQAHKRQTEQN